MKTICLIIVVITFLPIALLCQWNPVTNGITFNIPITTKVGIGITTPTELLHINNGALKIGNGYDAPSRAINRVLNQLWIAKFMKEK